MISWNSARLDLKPTVLALAILFVSAIVTLVESADIGIIGVGEATIPDLKQALQFLGIDETTFMQRTNATFKNAIKFVNWHQDPKEIGEHYFYHPFERPPNVTVFPSGTSG